MFLHATADDSFLALTLVQTLSLNNAPGWPAGSANLAGLVARDAACNNASECGLWTKFEIGTSPNGNPGYVFASSTDANGMNLPTPFSPGEFMNAPACPPPMLVGLCGIRVGESLNVRGLYGVPSGADVAVVSPATQSWMLSGSSVEVGMVAASGYEDSNDLRARFGMFQLYTNIASADVCEATFNDVLTSLQTP
jgi:hypothetical protein